LKNSVCVLNSFTHPPSVIRSPMGEVAFAIGLKLLVPTPGKNGSRAAKDTLE